MACWGYFFPHGSGDAARPDPALTTAFWAISLELPAMELTTATSSVWPSDIAKVAGACVWHSTVESARLFVVGASFSRACELYFRRLTVGKVWGISRKEVGLAYL